MLTGTEVATGNIREVSCPILNTTPLKDAVTPGKDNVLSY